MCVDSPHAMRRYVADFRTHHPPGRRPRPSTAPSPQRQEQTDSDLLNLCDRIKFIFPSLPYQRHAPPHVCAGRVGTAGTAV